MSEEDVPAKILGGDPPVEECKDCRFWSKGNCRKRAPQVVSTPTEFGPSYCTAWPRTLSTDYCGEFLAGRHPNVPEYKPMQPRYAFPEPASE
jgi:hypothetical protein